MTIYAELSKVLKVKYKPGEDIQAFLKKMISKADDLSDSEWEDLSPEAQEWVNNAVEAHDSDEEIDPPEGLDIDDDEDDDVGDDDEDELGDVEVDDDDDDEDTKQESPKARKAMKNGKNGKYATKSAPKATKAKAGRKAKTVEEEDKPVKKGKAKAAKTAKPEKKAKAEKSTKAAKPKKEKKAKGGGGRRERRFSDDQVITVVVDSNPKRPHTSSYERFELYKRGKKGMTVREALDAGVKSSDLSWDVDHGFIEIK